MTCLAVLGASGHGKVVAETAELCGWKSVVFFDDAYPSKRCCSDSIIKGDSSSLLESLANYDAVVVAIGDNQIRMKKLNELASRDARLTTLIHPRACVSRTAEIGEGSVIFAGVVVNADVKVGRGSILNTSCSVGHDCVLGIGTHIAPGARLAGGVRVGNFSWVGIGASIIQLIEIGERVVVGAGAVVIDDVQNGLTVVGVPARPF